MTEEASIHSFAKALRDVERLADGVRLCLDYENAIQRQRQRKRRELPSGLDPYDLAQTGWGALVAPEEKNRGAEDHLSLLFDMRRDQAGSLFRKEPYPKQRGRTFLWDKHGEAPGTIDPRLCRITCCSSAVPSRSLLSSSTSSLSITL